MDRFNMIEGFNEDEKWGNPDKMDFYLLLLLAAIRIMFRLLYDPEARFVVRVGYAKGGHSEKSQHYKGKAVDFIIVTDMSYKAQVEAMRNILHTMGVAERVGLGFYPDWNTPGFHLDTRGVMARWVRIGKKRKDWRYVGMDEGMKYIKGGKNV